MSKKSITTDYAYTPVMVKHPLTGRPTSVSIPQDTYIQLCRGIRDLKAVNLFIRNVAKTCSFEEGVSFSTVVLKAIVSSPQHAWANKS